jgi:hypothetical protein
VGGVAGAAAWRSGDVVAAVETQVADGEVAQAGHGPGSAAGADLAGVLGEGDVADVVQRLDGPVPAQQIGEAGRAGLSMANMAGRFIWSSVSEVVGRRPIYMLYLGGA